MNTPLTHDTPAGPADDRLVARLRAALDEVAATRPADAVPLAAAGRPRGRAAGRPAWQWAVAAAASVALVVVAVAVLRSDDRAALQPVATDGSVATTDGDGSPTMPYFLAAADLVPGEITEAGPCCPGTGSIATAWARNGDPTTGLLVAWTAPLYSSYMPELPADATTVTLGDSSISTVSYGIDAEEQATLTAAITQGSGLPWILPVEGWAWLGFSTVADAPALVQQFGGQVTLTSGLPLDAFLQLADATAARATEVLGLPAWVFTRADGTTWVLWQEAVTGRWTRLTVPAALADRVDGLVAAIVPVERTGDTDETDDTDGAAPSSLPAPSDDGLVRVVAVSGDPLPTFDTEAADTAIDRPIPAIATSAGEFAVDEPTLFVFAAHWCPHCAAELSVLVDGLAARAFTGTNVVIVSTAETTAGANYPASAWIAEYGWTGDVLYDDPVDDNGSAGVMAAAFGATGWPYLVAVDRHGVVTGRHAGEMPLEDVLALAATASAEVVGRLTIDAIGVDWYVVDGGSDHEAGMERGMIMTADRVTGTPTILGTRTTYGAPFLRLDELQPGDTFTYETLDGTRTFEVTLVETCQGDEVCAAQEGDDLLLATYDPEYTSRARLTVHATEVAAG